MACETILHSAGQLAGLLMVDLCDSTREFCKSVSKLHTLISLSLWLKG